MKFLLSLVFLLSSNLVYSACLETSAGKIMVKFTAFKTPLKLGVSGKFPSKSLARTAKGDNWIEATLKNTITIDASKIDTGDKPRDKKIAKFFFENKKLEATVTNVSTKKKQLILRVLMNGKVLKKVLMSYTFKNNKLMAQGHVDAFDFGMNKQLAALNKACFAKHEGKTWSDVKINMVAEFGSCK
jgi:hypothetical protein